MAGGTSTAVAPENVKTLSFMAILTICANTMNGPGLTTLPDTAVSAGIGMFVLMIALSVAMAAYVCRRMVHAMWGSLGPGAASSDEEESLLKKATPSSSGSRRPILEKTSIVGQATEAYGPGAGVATAVVMVASALCLALAQMVVCAAILDSISVLFLGKSCAISLAPSDSWIHCTDAASMAPFAATSSPASIFSVGTALAAAATIPLGMVNLDEMMGAQYALFGCLILACTQFCFTMARGANDLANDAIMNNAIIDEPSAWLGPTPFAAVGPIMFNFAFIVTAPPLSTMARSENGARNAMAAACAVMGTLYAIVGCVGAPLANMLDEDTNLLSLVLHGEVGTLDLIAVAFFGLSMMASVPVYCLLAEETLVNDAGLAKGPAFFLAKILPWILVAFTYNASFFAAFVNWSGLLILGYANFSLPLLLDATLTTKRWDNALDRGGDINKEAQWLIRAVFSLVTGGISAVIAISIVNSLVFAGVVFIFMIVLAALAP